MMPIPKPNSGEAGSDFIKRCMADPVMQEYDPDQRAAICHCQFVGDEKNLSGEWLFGGEVSSVSDWQMILPVGEFKTAKYGELVITRELVDAIVVNWQNRALGERLPFIDTDHDQGAANGWIVELKAEDTGLFAKIEWTDIGRENVEKRRYRYFSAMIAEHQIIATGEKVWPVLKAVSLTNTPVMDNMPAVSLNDKSAHSDAADPQKGESMNYEQIVNALAGLTDEQRAELAKLLGEKEPEKKEESRPEDKPVELSETDKDLRLSTQEKVIQQMSETIANLTEKVQAVLDRDMDKNVDTFIQAALSEGKILPADETFWRTKYRRDPKMVEQILGKMPKAVDFTVRGTASADGEAIILTDKQRKALADLKVSEEQFRAVESKK